jgi:hypothetical protein
MHESAIHRPGQTGACGLVASNVERLVCVRRRCKTTLPSYYKTIMRIVGMLPWDFDPPLFSCRLRLLVFAAGINRTGSI